MPNEFIWEIIGYAGSLLVLVSLLMSSVIRLRIINTVGSLIFCIYAIAIRSYPTAVMNGALVIINICFLVKIMNTERSFTLVSTERDDPTVIHFLKKYEADISRYFGMWDESAGAADTVFIAFRDDNIAGLTMGISDESNGFEFLIDYSTPHYRDCKLGQFVYESLQKNGYKTLSYSGTSEVHRAYLRKMGFSDVNRIMIKIAG